MSYSNPPGPGDESDEDQTIRTNYIEERSNIEHKEEERVQKV